MFVEKDVYDRIINAAVDQARRFPEGDWSEIVSLLLENVTGIGDLRDVEAFHRHIMRELNRRMARLGFKRRD